LESLNQRVTLLVWLAAASHGLMFVSESDAPFTTVDAAQHAFATLDDAAVRGLVGRPSTDPVETMEVDAFFHNAVQDQPWHTHEEKATVRRYRKLVALIHKVLPDAKVFRVGRISIDVLILGTGPGGGALGLATHVVET